MSKRKSLDELLEEALINARNDRAMTLGAYDKMKEALDTKNPDATVTMGKTASDLLEQLTRSNEQIVRLAQIRERQEAREPKEDKDEPIDIEALQKAYDESLKDSKN